MTLIEPLWRGLRLRLARYFKTANELLLIAPKDVSNLTDSASDALSGYSGGDPAKDSRIAEYRHLRDQLILAMRTDLAMAGVGVVST